jgi:hypothetical protein
VTYAYYFAVGTSMAAPHVSGVAALIAGKYGHGVLRPAQIEAIIQQSADDILAPGADPYSGKGQSPTHPIPPSCAFSESGDWSIMARVISLRHTNGVGRVIVNRSGRSDRAPALHNVGYTSRSAGVLSLIPPVLLVLEKFRAPI